MFNKKVRPDNIDNWICIYETSNETEARLVEAFIRNLGMECELLSKKDSAYSVNFGDLSALFIYVPHDKAEEAKKSLKQWKEGKIKFKGTDVSTDDNSIDHVDGS
ncbi:MAG: hypothetical protein WD097_04355 [Balneolales bacterium]